MQFQQANVVSRNTFLKDSFPEQGLWCMTSAQWGSSRHDIMQQELQRAHTCACFLSLL